MVQAEYMINCGRNLRRNIKKERVAYERMSEL